MAYTETKSKCKNSKMGQSALVSWCVHIATKRNKIATQHLKIAT